MRIDGIRVDAVTSMLYRDYGRNEGEWIPNHRGGNENFEAIAFLEKLNQMVHENHSNVLMFAEESSSFKGITAKDGLGFDVKWSLGWMNDTLDYFAKPFDARPDSRGVILHEFSYMQEEKHMLVLSHDEVVHGKKHFLNKVPGNEWERFAGVKLLFSYMMCHPGKKLLFMGSEVGPWHEWDSKEKVCFALLEIEHNKALHESVKALNHFYLNHPQLWSDDFTLISFEEACLAYMRQDILCVHNFSNKRVTASIPCLANSLTEIFPIANNHTISVETGGAFRIQLSPLATAIFKVS